MDFEGLVEGVKGNQSINQPKNIWDNQRQGILRWGRKSYSSIKGKKKIPGPQVGAGWLSQEARVSKEVR